MAAFFVRIAPVEAPGDPVHELESIVPQLHGVIDVDVGVGRKVPAQKLKGPTWRIPRSPNASNGDLLFSNNPTAELLLRTLDYGVLRMLSILLQLGLEKISRYGVTGLRSD